MVIAFVHRLALDANVDGAVWLVPPAGCPSLCFPAALEALEIHAIRTPAYPVFMTQEQALQRKATPDVQPDSYLRRVSPDCAGGSYQNRCLQ